MANRPFKTQPFFIDKSATAGDDIVYSFYKKRINTIQESYPDELLMGVIYDGRYNSIYAVYSDVTLDFYNTMIDKLHIFNVGNRTDLNNNDNTDNENVGIDLIELDDDLEKVYQIIKNNQPIKTKEITELFDEFSQRQIERFIKELKELKRIKYVGSRRYGAYYIYEFDG